MEHPEESISRRTLSARSLVASLLVAVLALTGCSAGGESGDAEGSERVTKAEGVSISAVSPSSGALLGGETVTLRGDGLDRVSGVTFGDAAATSVVRVNNEVVEVVVPTAVDYSVGSVAVTATTPQGEVISSEANYDYQVVTDVDAQMEYAFAHWQDYNLDDWGVFDENDCGNFVNQTLVARGWAENAEWYSEWATTGDFSYSWARGPAMDDYFASQTARTTRLSLDQRAQVKVGDVVMFDWDPEAVNGVDHTMLVSKVDPSTGAISLSGHTVDARYRDLDDAIMNENPGATAWFYSIA